MNAPLDCVSNPRLGRWPLQRADGGTRPRVPRGGAQGFSLIEVTMVVLLIGIVLVIATPSMRAMRRTQTMRQARSQVIDDVRSARQIAITHRTRVIVAFGAPLVSGVATTNTYTVHSDKNGDAAIQTGETVTIHTLPKSVLFNKLKLKPADSLYFEISGLLKPGTNGGFLVVKSDNRMDTVTVSVAGIAYEK